ncbi:hypothetical protein BD289DRAFT_439435 [Coniella lustricola]|uniref:Uncharacterized protein n=1 Tax=Coniella lustricola TaxID=2025994 RepID=A0A2T3A1J8_9PEZI|nr:hypothetical protein BD289DRAFT_439435 [Coniella lustricola]
MDMYFGLLTNGILPAWYTLSFPVTFILEPGLLMIEEVTTRWKSTGPPGETEDELLQRVETTLTNFYTKRGFTLIASAKSGPNEYGLPTMARIIRPGDYFRVASDTLSVPKLPDWTPPATTRGLSTSPTPSPVKAKDPQNGQDPQTAQDPQAVL